MRRAAKSGGLSVCVVRLVVVAVVGDGDGGTDEEEAAEDMVDAWVGRGVCGGRRNRGK